MNPTLNSLLQWSVENSTSNPNGNTPQSTDHRLNPDAINELFGGPSDAELMIASMSAIRSSDPEITLEDKLVAFDNFEQLVENLDNANILGPTQLWIPLLDCLGHEEAEIRKMAAWSVGTAVQNNQKCQEVLLENGGLEKLVGLAVGENQGDQVRRKAVYALSSATRNYQPAMDALITTLGKFGKEYAEIDASDMDACDTIMGKLRREVLETSAYTDQLP